VAGTKTTKFLRLAFLFVIVQVLCTTIVQVNAEDKTVPWFFGMPQGGKTFDILQCQSATFDWNQFGDGSPHSVWEFDNEEAYASCSFDEAQPIMSSRNAGSVTISGTQTLDVTKRWFASSNGDDCIAGKMKAALKIRPLLQYKFENRKCTGGTVDVTKTEDTVKACRKRCKRRRGCRAIQYQADTGGCAIYSVVPTGISLPDVGSSCEVATTSCDPTATLALAEPPTPAPPTPAPPTLPPTPAPFTCASGFSSRQTMGLVKNPPMDEASGIVSGYRNTRTLYTHNDFTGRPEVYAIATSPLGDWSSGQLQGVFKLGNAGFVDYEDIAMGPGPNGSGYIYAGDIGDNDDRRNSIVIYRAAEPDLSRGSYRLTDTSSLELEYPRGKGINAECLMFDSYDDRLYIITKEKGEIYRTPTVWGSGNAQMTLIKVGDVGTTSSDIVGCDISRNGREILIKTYGSVYYFCRDQGASLVGVLERTGSQQPYAKEPQGEAVCFANDRNGGFYTLSESTGRSTTPLYYYSRN